MIPSDGRALLNIGCGMRWHAEWTNLDYSAFALEARYPWLYWMLARAGLSGKSAAVAAGAMPPHLVFADVRRGLPFPGGAFDVVYHSHVLEHVDRERVPAFLAECRRVLKPGGVLRVVVPDLERLARNYLAALEAALGHAPSATDGYEWAVLELLDQMVRTRLGGGMKVYLDRKAGRHATQGSEPGLRARLRRWLLGTPDPVNTGELHRWMYDRYSLPRVLEAAGFTDLALCEAGSSRISGWGRFGLDVNPDGSPYIAGSLYAEGVRAR